MNFSFPKNVLYFFAFLLPATGFADWANPPVACIEDQVPHSLPCLDLTKIESAVADVPPELTEAELKYWTIDHRPDLSLCRAKEVYRREANAPGSQAAGEIAWAWMWMKQVEGLDLKIDSIYEAAESADMPPQILFGALKQESLLSNLGITSDGGNYSCGIGQINLIEWCEYMQTLSKSDQTQMGWPIGVSCKTETLTTELVEPFYEIALKRLGKRPDYELTPAEFAGITEKEILSKFPPATNSIQKRRFRAVSSFVKTCADVRHGIAAKGYELRRLFETYVPKGLKKIETYSRGESFPASCRRPYRSSYYPLHTGWLLADAIYNAGARQVSVLEYYFRMTKASHESGEAWKNMNPLFLIEGLHWGGKWNPATKKIEYQNVYGEKASQSWFKSCVVQRHIARVVQYTTLPGYTLASSLEQGGCSRTSVPKYRIDSSGRKSLLNLEHERPDF
jgi:hypothetical protein